VKASRGCALPVGMNTVGAVFHSFGLG
jgi:hypothetical protein